MAVDPEIQAYLDAIAELQAAATEAKNSIQGFKQAQGPGGGQQAKGDGSLGHPSEPLSQTIAKQAAISQLVMNFNGGGGIGMGDEGLPPDQRIGGIYGKNGPKAGQSIGGWVKDPNSGTWIRPIGGSGPGGGGGGEPKRNPNYSPPDPNGPFQDWVLKGQWKGLRSERTGYVPHGIPTPEGGIQSLASDMPGIIGKNRFIGAGSEVARRFTTWRMNEAEIWDNLQSTAKSAADASWHSRVSGAIAGQGDGAIDAAYRNIRYSKMGVGRQESLLTTDITPILKGGLDSATGGASTFLMRNFKGITWAVGTVYNIHEDVREAYFQEKATQRMQPGLAKSIAQIQLRQDNEDRVRNNVTHALVTAALMSGVGIPIAAAIEGANYAYSFARDLYSKRYTEQINKESGIADLVRQYSLGDTNKPATERAKEFTDKFQTAGEFRAQLESALDDVNRGYARVGLGDFRNDIARNGGAAYLARADQKLHGIAPMWYDPGKIFSMLNSSRLATRQFASTQTQRAKNRTGG